MKTYIHVRGLVWDEIVAITERLKDLGIGSNFSQSAICIHCSAEKLGEVAEDLVWRIVS